MNVRTHCRKVHSVAYNVVADSTGEVYLHSFSWCFVWNLRNSLKIRTYTVQGHPRSSILVSIESSYTISY